MLRVLLVDDEPLIKAAFRKMIPWEDEGFQIAGTASNGLEALRLLETCPADIVITDLKMPQMNGIELIRALQKNQFEGVMLVLSNYADFELVREALVAGAMDYMLKVNLNAETLLGQLHSAREALSARLKTHQRERMAEEHSAVVRAHALRAWLLADAQEDAALPAALLDAYAPEQGPFGICDVLFLPHPQGSAAHLPSVQHVESILRAIFEDVPDTDILILGDREICCVYPLAGLLARGLQAKDKHEQIIKQVSMYFNTTVLLITPSPAGSLDDLRAQCLACRDAHAVSFYALPSAIAAPESLMPGNIPAGFSPDAMAEQMAEACLHRDGDDTGKAIEGLLDACRDVMAAPAQVIAFLTHVGESLLKFTPAESETDALRQSLAALESCLDERSLLAQATDLYARILAQIIPPAFAHCKENVRTALLYMHMHYTERITLEDIARAASLDRSYLCRLFKRETGHNLFGYLNGLRMNAAARLMEDGDVYIREVAGLVGIDDPFYFTRLFKKHFGVNPSEYRSGKPSP